MKRYFSVVSKAPCTGASATLSPVHLCCNQREEKREKPSPKDDQEANSISSTVQQTVTNAEISAVQDPGLKVLFTSKTRSGSVVKLARGSVVNFKGSCIVNAANERGLGGGGVDGAVNAAGGREIIEARRALPEVSPGIRIPAGQAKVTKAFGSLHCQHVIHACSADYNDPSRTREESDVIVRRAYKNALERAVELKATSVGFSLLSAGIYRGDCSLEHVLEQGIRVIKDFTAASTGLTIYLVAFTEEECDTLKSLFKKHLEISRM